jgi:hypothetical protein
MVEALHRFSLLKGEIVRRNIPFSLIALLLAACNGSPNANQAATPNTLAPPQRQYQWLKASAR